MRRSHGGPGGADAPVHSRSRLPVVLVPAFLALIVSSGACGPAEPAAEGTEAGPPGAGAPGTDATAPGADGGEGGDPTPAWEWSWERIRDTVAAVRAGRDLTPGSWPGGARVAVLLSFDVDNETIPLRYGEPTIGGLSQGEFGARRGLPRVLALLDRYRVPASFFIPAVSLGLSPGQADLITASGRHEIGIHGWVHERNSRLDSATERALVERALAEVEELSGYRPVGYRAPSWDFSPHTLGIIRELGFLYDSSLMADDRPYELLSHGEPTGMVELPVQWILDDAPLFDPLGDRYESPREVLQTWKDEFDRAREEGTVFVLTMHPHIIGHRSRIVVLRELIEYVRGRGDAWFATHRAAVDHVRASAGMEGAGAAEPGEAGP